MNAEVAAFVGLGSNLDDPPRQLQAAAALSALSRTRGVALSRFYRSPPWGPIEQPDFVNAVAELRTTLSAEDLLQGLLHIERAAGRIRRERWGPRVLDLDLLLYADACIARPGLQVPHPRLRERAFVLVPLAEIAPDLLVPGQGRVADLLRELPAQAADARPLVALG